jgi:hypothetical protein
MLTKSIQQLVYIGIWRQETRFCGCLPRIIERQPLGVYQPAGVAMMVKLSIHRAQVAMLILNAAPRYQEVSQ